MPDQPSRSIPLLGIAVFIDADDGLGVAYVNDQQKFVLEHDLSGTREFGLRGFVFGYLGCGKRLCHILRLELACWMSDA